MFSVFSGKPGDPIRHYSMFLTPLAGILVLTLLLLPMVAQAAGTITVDTPTDDFGGELGSCALR